MNRILIKSMNTVEVHCITEGLRIDSTSSSTKIQSYKDKTNYFYMAKPT